MILLDVNLLIHAAVQSSPAHARAYRWLDDQVVRGVRVGVPWASLLGFVRIAAGAGIFAEPLTTESAMDQVDRWLATPGFWIPEPRARHAGLVRGLLAGSGVRARDVPDAHLAALALEHDLTLCTADKGFARFEGLRWLNPLA